MALSTLDAVVDDLEGQVSVELVHDGAPCTVAEGT
jgi:hypothetical protein